ncbi:MAG: BMP family ABC transporter substrate-binding protein [Clostridia bacterium]|nr:BMP family ABC transporter substrate-binding protein [Clostridia bacterium]
MKMKHILTVAVCLAVLVACSFLFGFWNKASYDGVLKVGFVYAEDESTPYTRNFVQASHLLADEFGDKVEIMSKSNVLSKDSEDPMLDLIRKGCKLLFINLDTEIPVKLAEQYPDVTFCHISMPGITMEGKPANYHTFNGEIYQARYAAGIVAGMKLRELLDSGAIRPQDALVGYVAANDSAEVISGYTAFLLGIRSVAPEASMRVRKTGTWSSYNLEKQRARELIAEGCIIISQHTNTMAPAIACEEAAQNGTRVYYVGYHQSMMDVAPTTALVSLRTFWYPYIKGAVSAVIQHEEIESYVSGNDHGRDMSAGFSDDWVQMLELNRYVAAAGTEEKLNNVIKNFKAGRVDVFRGNYTGVRVNDPNDTIDLRNGFTENENSSQPSFNYILKDCVVLEN